VTESLVPGAVPTGSVDVVGSRLRRLKDIAAELGDDVIASDAQAEHERLMEARFFVVCLGQFKRGKSTLLNALVDQPILPVGVVPVTTVVTILRYGEQPAATVRFSDGQTQQVALDAIAMFIDERQNPANHRGATVVDIVLPSSILLDGLCLVDTPGLGSVHTANTEATRAFVPRTDVALIVVGPDPPISGAELELIEEVSRQSGELIVVLNKADQASREQLHEVTQFTRTTIEKALEGPVAKIFETSALERLTQRHPTRDWRALETHLRHLSVSARQHLVETAGFRSVRRLAHRLGAELAHRGDALRKPIGEIEGRVTRLRAALGDLDRSLVDLRFLFDAVEADLGRQFAEYRTRFFRNSVSELQARLAQWIADRGPIDCSLRSQALEQAHRLATRAVDQWLGTIEPEAHALYRSATERFVRLANEYMSRAAADAGDVDADDLPPEMGFRGKRQFYFTSLMHVTGGSPLTWLLDRFAPRAVRQTQIARAADGYLVHLLESNSHRVENDLKDRTRESGRWLEGQIRTRLSGALHSAERALAIATEKQHLSELQVRVRVERVHVLQEELVGLTG
jgi:ribosome biogenesis GTPase A